MSNNIFCYIDGSHPLSPPKGCLVVCLIRKGTTVGSLTSTEAFHKYNRLLPILYAHVQTTPGPLWQVYYGLQMIFVLGVEHNALITI